ncbi:hypothetical protein EV179_000979 [Coemansia sp. RSA 487]|nr:hypothetical protein EV179_000979 [Coemansia sp. RSA 487]
MVKLTKRDKEKIQQVQEIEAQLRASANAASQVVGSWLGDSDNDDDEGTKDAKEGAVQQSKVAVKARDVFQGRPARLGVGAKFLSHKDMVEGNRGGDHVVSLGPGVLTSEELRLKRRLTKGAGARKDEDGPGGTKRTAQQANKDDEDEGDSKSKVIVTALAAIAAVAAAGEAHYEAHPAPGQEIAHPLPPPPPAAVLPNHEEHPVGYEEHPIVPPPPPPPPPHAELPHHEEHPAGYEAHPPPPAPHAELPHHEEHPAPPPPPPHAELPHHEEHPAGYEAHPPPPVPHAELPHHEELPAPGGYEAAGPAHINPGGPAYVANAPHF